MSINNSNDTIGNRTRDLPVCSAVPQPTAPPRAPYKWQANIFKTEPHASPASLQPDTLWGALHWRVADMLPPEQHWYTATSSARQPMNYMIASTSFQLILLSVFILYLLCYTLSVDSGYSPFPNSYFDTPCQTVVLWTEESCLLFEFCPYPANAESRVSS